MSESITPTERHLQLVTITSAVCRAADHLGLAVSSVWVRPSTAYSPAEADVQFDGPRGDEAVEKVNRYADALGLTELHEYSNYARHAVIELDGHTVRLNAYCGHPNPPQKDDAK